MKILRVADVPYNRTGGMHHGECIFVGDELTKDGHEVDYLFHEEIGLQWADYRVRDDFSIPPADRPARPEPTPDEANGIRCRGNSRAIGRRLLRRPLQFDRNLPPLIVVSHGVESRCHRGVMLDYLHSGREINVFHLKQRYRVSNERHCGNPTSLSDTLIK